MSKNIYLILFLSSVCGLIWGFFFDEYVFSSGDSLYKLSAASIAGLLSLMAIENNRELKNKDKERSDLDEVVREVFNILICFDKLKVYSCKKIINMKEYYLEEAKQDKLYSKLKTLDGKKEGREQEVFVIKKSLSQCESNKKEFFLKINRNGEDETEALVNIYESNNKMNIAFKKIIKNHGVNEDSVDKYISYFNGFTMKCGEGVEFIENEFAYLLDREATVLEKSRIMELNFNDSGFPEKEDYSYKLIEEISVLERFNPFLKSVSYSLFLHKCYSEITFFFFVGVIGLM
ncbi:hypothetical protein M0220_05155 [Halomonas qinghailakensis]|uniref:Uncharacterized protein n=1 Tax=Halomonas qinghailakensis TaxID=2937790 RepID=A0AA46YSK9_9GAMM|nr:hypothetical protein [Halomonas sp. ZZQ-149]UYO75547.1 hypothetical protein M0220_05155 [Halomonas sp. ZZQ-149]